MTAPMPPFRPQAVAAYRDGTVVDAPPHTPRSAKSPLIVLAVLLTLAAVFVVVARIPRAVDAVVVGTSDAGLVAVVTGRLDPLPSVGAPARGAATGTQPVDLTVVGGAVVDDNAGLLRWRLPTTVPLPVTVVLLETPAGGPASPVGRVSIRIANPTVLHSLLTQVGVG